MKKTLFTLLYIAFMLPTGVVRCQDGSEGLTSATDTVFSVLDTLNQTNTWVMKGNFILPNTWELFNLQWAGLYLSRFTTSDCMDDGYETGHLPSRITAIDTVDSMITIQVQVTATCGCFFIGGAELKEDSLLCLNYTEYGSLASCPCCYGLTYTFEMLDNEAEKKATDVMVTDVPGSRRSLVQP